MADTAKSNAVAGSAMPHPNPLCYASRFLMHPKHTHKRCTSLVLPFVSIFSKAHFLQAHPAVPLKTTSKPGDPELVGRFPAITRGAEKLLGAA